jgi:transposase
MYARVGRPSIPPEKLLRPQLLQMLYSIRSERLLREEMDYNLLFRWFVGLNADDEVGDAITFTKNRDRLLEADVAQEFLARVVAQARAKGLTSEADLLIGGSMLTPRQFFANSLATVAGVSLAEWILSPTSHASDD